MTYQIWKNLSQVYWDLVFLFWNENKIQENVYLLEWLQTNRSGIRVETIVLYSELNSMQTFVSLFLTSAHKTTFGCIPWIFWAPAHSVAYIGLKQPMNWPFLRSSRGILGVYSILYFWWYFLKICIKIQYLFTHSLWYQLCIIS